MRITIVSSLLGAIVALAVVVPGAASAGPLGPLPASWQKGLDIGAFWWRDLDGPLAQAWIRRASTSAKASQVTFAVPWYQYFSARSHSDHLNANEIHPSYGTTSSCRGQDGSNWTRCKTPSMASLQRAIRLARRQGMKVGLKPLVEVGRDPASAQRRDGINRSGRDRDAWFRSYKAMLSQYARLARDTGVDTLVIGTGLTGMTDDADDLGQWRAIVSEIRDGRLMGDGRGFAGMLTYAAEWSSIAPDARSKTAEKRMFWDALDEIGIEAYFPLVSPGAGGDNPSVETLRAGWHRDVAHFGASPVELLRALHEKYGKPVIFTGLGYLSRGGTAVYPAKGDAEQRAAGGRIRVKAQLNAYRAAFDTWTAIARDEGWFDGIHWWAWEPAYATSVRGSNGRVVARRDGGYAPQGKPAEAELCQRHLGREDSSCRPSRLGVAG